MDARTGIYSERVEPSMKTYKLDDRDSITVLHFLAQFKQPCDSNRVSEDMNLRMTLTAMEVKPASSSTLQMTFSGDDETTHWPLKTGKDKTFT